MSPLPSFLLLPGVFLASWWLTGRFRRYALARRVLDIPNVRSSHAEAMPRGGGVAIVVATLVALAVLSALGAVARRPAWGLLGGGGLVALIGFVDDRRNAAPHWRLIGHVAAAVWVVVWLGGSPPLPVFGSLLKLGSLGYGLAALYLVWMLNLTNFMDGIDGIASIETITVCLAGVLLYAFTGPIESGWLSPLVLASATLGFLVWNWPPAKIFLGDTGSGFLGLMLAALSLQAGWASPNLSWSWVILLGVFIVDATLTLIRRVVRGERFYEAHRSHAYQHAARRWGAHKPVTLTVGAINLCWLFPISLLVARGSVAGWFGLAIAYAPLVWVAAWLKAGE
jgi:Fuc2NAc and GlcNAc transferase